MDIRVGMFTLCSSVSKSCKTPMPLRRTQRYALSSYQCCSLAVAARVALGSSETKGVMSSRSFNTFQFLDEDACSGPIVAIQ